MTTVKPPKSRPNSTLNPTLATAATAKPSTGAAAAARPSAAKGANEGTTPVGFVRSASVRSADVSSADLSTALADVSGGARPARTQLPDLNLYPGWDFRFFPPKRVAPDAPAIPADVLQQLGSAMQAPPAIIAAAVAAAKAAQTQPPPAKPDLSAYLGWDFRFFPPNKVAPNATPIPPAVIQQLGSAMQAPAAVIAAAVAAAKAAQTQPLPAPTPAASAGSAGALQKQLQALAAGRDGNATFTRANAASLRRLATLLGATYDARTHTVVLPHAGGTLASNKGTASGTLTWTNAAGQTFALPHRHPVKIDKVDAKLETITLARAASGGSAASTLTLPTALFSALVDRLTLT